MIQVSRIMLEKQIFHAYSDLPTAEQHLYRSIAPPPLRLDTSRGIWLWILLQLSRIVTLLLLCYKNYCCCHF